MATIQSLLSSSSSSQLHSHQRHRRDNKESSSLPIQMTTTGVPEPSFSSAFSTSSRQILTDSLNQGFVWAALRFVFSIAMRLKTTVYIALGSLMTLYWSSVGLTALTFQTFTTELVTTTIAAWHHTFNNTRTCIEVMNCTCSS